MKINHQEMVAILVKPGQTILSSLSPDKCHLLHMASKLCSEAGELMDAIGKNIYYEKPLDINNVREELGDMEFYMEGLRHALHITREETLNANIEKLSLRYPNLQYTNQAAQERADKK